MRWAAEEGVLDLHSSIETPDGRVNEASDDGVQDEGKDLRGRAGRPPSEPGAPAGPLAPALLPPSSSVEPGPPTRRRRGSPRTGPSRPAFSPNIPRRPSCPPLPTSPSFTCKGKLGIRQVTPKPTSSTLVKAKARVALQIFWIRRSRGFFFFSPLQAGGRVTHGLPPHQAPRAKEGPFPACCSGASQRPVTLSLLPRALLSQVTSASCQSLTNKARNDGTAVPGPVT